MSLVSSNSPLGFTLSGAARTAMTKLAADAEKATRDKVAAISIGWGRIERPSQATVENVIVGVYTHDQRENIALRIVALDGFEIVFFLMDSDFAKFEHKQLEHSAGRGFFLND